MNNSTYSFKLQNIFDVEKYSQALNRSYSTDNICDDSLSKRSSLTCNEFKLYDTKFVYSNKTNSFRNASIKICQYGINKTNGANNEFTNTFKTIQSENMTRRVPDSFCGLYQTIDSRLEYSQDIYKINRKSIKFLLDDIMNEEPQIQAPLTTNNSNSPQNKTQFLIRYPRMPQIKMPHNSIFSTIKSSTTDHSRVVCEQPCRFYIFRSKHYQTKPSLLIPQIHIKSRQKVTLINKTFKYGSNYFNTDLPQNFLIINNSQDNKISSKFSKTMNPTNEKKSVKLNEYNICLLKTGNQKSLTINHPNYQEVRNISNHYLDHNADYTNKL